MDPDVGLEVARILEEHAEEIAADVEAANQAEIAAYREQSREFLAESYAVSLASVSEAASLLRGTSLVLEDVSAWAALGRRRARQEFPLHAVVQSFQISTRVFYDRVVELTQSLGPHADKVVIDLIRMSLRIMTQGVAAVSESYIATRLEIEVTRQQAVDRLFSDLLLGLVDDTELPRATAVGLRPAPAYVAAVASSERATADDAPPLLTVDAPPGCLTGTVGTIAVLVVPDRPDEAHVVANAIERFRTAVEKFVGAPNALVAVGGSRPGLTGVKESMEEAMRIFTVARGLDVAGTVTRDEVLVPTLLMGAPDSARSLIGLLGPLRDPALPGRDGLIDTLRTYLAEGLSVHRTAERLFAHRNTVRARLRRIEELLGFAVASRRIELELALLADGLDLADDG